MKPHKHAAVIKAWADGATIQIKHHESGGWIDTDSPQWGNFPYRVKPEVVYPVTQMTNTAIEAAYNSSNYFGISLKAIANAAIRQAIDSGQVHIKETE